MANPLAALTVARALVRPQPEERRPRRRREEPRRDDRVFLAELYVAGVDRARVDALARRLAAAADELSQAGVEVRLLGSAGVPGDESFLSLFAAREEDAVARTIARAEIAADRIVPVLWQADHAH